MKKYKLLRIFLVGLLLSALFISPDICSGLDFTETFTIYKLWFKEERVNVAFSKGTYDAKTNLLDGIPYTPTSWTITCKSSDCKEATIDNNGIVTFNKDGGGEYEIRASFPEGPDCDDSFTLIVKDCPEIEGSVSFDAFIFSLTVPAEATGEPDDDGYCTYDVNGAGIAFEMPHASISIAPVQLENVHLRFKMHPDGPFKDVTFTWTGNKKFKVGIIDALLSNVSLNINAAGELSGSVDLHVSLNEDIRVKEVAFLRKGITGKIVLKYSNVKSWAGVSWDFGGVTNIVIDIEKNGAILAKAQGSLSSDGVLDTSLTAVPGGATYRSNGYEVEVPAGGLSIHFKYHITKTDIQIISGTGNFNIKGVEGIEGDLSLGLSFDPQTIDATVGVEKAKAFRMNFSDVNLTASFNWSFDTGSIKGQLSAKHDEFNAAFENVDFEVNLGRLVKFGVKSAQMEWKKFEVSIKDALYVHNAGLKFDIGLVILGMGSVEIQRFMIDQSGRVSLDKIKGDINKSPVNVSFSAQFAASSFSGSFNGTFPGNVGIGGTVAVGVQGGASSFTYAYLQLAVGTNIPLGSSGLKLREISGEFGYNWDASASEGGAGGPRQGTHTIGLGLKLSDTADLMLLGGYMRLILGNASKMTLIGNVQVTASTEYFKGEMTINYTFGSMQVDGSLTSSLKIPSSGSIIMVDRCVLNYKVASSRWWANGDMQGKFFNNDNITIQGVTDIKAPLSSPSGLTGYFSGKISASLEDNITYPDGFNPSSCSTADATDNFVGFGFKGEYDLKFGGSTTAYLNQHGISGSFTIYVNFSGKASVKWPCLIFCGEDCVDTYDLSAAGYLTATQKSGSDLNIKGRLTFSGGGNSREAEIDLTF